MNAATVQALSDDGFPPSATRERPKKSNGDFPVTWVSDAVLSLDAKPVVKGLIEFGSFVVVYGPSGSGKSFFTADLVQHIAMGLPWRGHKVTRGLVVYVASEAGASILKRFVGWRDRNVSETSERIPIAVMTRGPNLLGGTDFETLAAQLVALQIESGLPLAVVVFDTLSRSIPGGDENKSEDMTRVVQSADKLRDQFNCATVFVHHSGKDITKGARGHSALFAAADLVLSVNEKTATAEKVRDGVSGESFYFALDPIELGTDSDGDAVMTCLLRESSEPAKSKSAPARGSPALALMALREAIEAHGETLPGGSTIPKSVKGVTLIQWRERFDIRYGKDGATPARQAFYKARVKLLETKAIGISDPWVWAY